MVYKAEKRDFVVLIPCYNNREGLVFSIKSIQYPKPLYEILVVDDGSSPPISENALQLEFPDTAIHLIRLDSNAGVVYALNTGLRFIHEHSNCAFIARLDCGDSCDALRFAKQVHHLRNDAALMLSGSWCRFVRSGNQESFIYKAAEKHEAILQEMHYQCSFIHPGVMFKKEVLSTVGLYPNLYPHAEDYAFFWLILKKHKGEILPEVLTDVYFHNKNISSKNYRSQLTSRINIIKAFGTSYFHKNLGILLVQLRLVLPTAFIHRLKMIIKGT